MTQLRGAVAAISGAASGIGRALAIHWAREGASLALADRRTDDLRETAAIARASGATVSIHEVDVSDRAQVERWAAEAVAAHGRVSVLVNNAGVALHGLFDELSVADFEWLLGVNFWGVFYGMKAFMPALRREPSAHIVNVSSVFGIVGPAGQSAYATSKFAVRGLSESVRHELGDTNIRLSVVHPGGVKTNIAARARYHDDVPEATREYMARRFQQLAALTPERAAEIITAGVRKNAPRILVGKDAHAIDLLQRFRPATYWSFMRRAWNRTQVAARPGVANSTRDA